jgi:competence protein ComEC
LAIGLRPVAAAAFLVCTAWILWSPLARVRGSRPTGLLRLTVIDVGQADALLVRFPDARTMLVDAGGSRTGGSFDVGMRVIAPALWRHDVFRLDRFVLSHGDPDHIGGAVALLRAFRIGALWEGIDVPRDAALQAVHREAAARRVPSTFMRAGDRLHSGGTELTVLHPPPPDWERQKVRNDDSIVLEITFGRVSLLLTGDISAQVERTLRGRLSAVPIRIMKAPHHGSTGSSSPAFLAAAQPALAFFTVGPAALGAPALRSVMARYAAAGAEVLSTGQDGAVEIETDGREVRVATFSGRRLTLSARQPRVLSPLSLEPQARVPSSRLIRPHSLSISSSVHSCSDRPRAWKRRSSSVKRFANLSSARLSADSGSIPSLRERFAMANSRSPISSASRSRSPPC